MSETGCIFGCGGGLSAFSPIQRTRNQRQGNIGGNSESDTRGSGNRGCQGDEGFEGCCIQNVLMYSAIDTQLCPYSSKWPSSLSGL